MRYVYIAACWALFTSTAVAQPIALQTSNFSELQNWQSQSHIGALQAFKRSCKRGIKPKGEIAKWVDVSAWQQACNQAVNATSARHFFEKYFQPYRVSSEQPAKVTGYYIPLLEGSFTQGGEYQWPLYRVPEDFKKPYLTRAQIESGALQGKKLELVWLKDPIMRFFLHVQGSGHIQLPDGRVITAQFAAKNGQTYRSIGKEMLKRGLLQPHNVSLQSIRDYLRAHPEQIREVFDHNESYIFFTLNQSGEMPKGAQSVPLTPMHSLAVDPRYWSYGLPMYLQPSNTLTMIQDTGSAIKGVRRGDLFVGLGDEAESIAGRMNGPQDWTILLPKP